MISLIWAVDESGLIGDGSELPWHIPAELQYFKKTTMGSPIVMGRRTFESIGKPLPGRENIILTRNRDFENDELTIFHKVSDFLDYAEKHDGEIFVIGGAQIYDALFKYASKLYVTKINHSFLGDTYFPVVSMNDFKLVSQEKGLRDKDNDYDYDHLVYERF